MYGKIFSSMFQGSLHGQWEAIVTFTVMIVLADQDGELDMTPEALSAVTSIPLEVIRKGIASLEAEDPQSRTPDENGRRIVRVSPLRAWGWRITNYAHYRAMRTAEERREYFREHKRKQRAASTGETSNCPPESTGGHTVSSESTNSSKQKQREKQRELAAADVGEAAPVARKLSLPDWDGVQLTEEARAHLEAFSRAHERPWAFRTEIRKIGPGGLNESATWDEISDALVKYAGSEIHGPPGAPMLMKFILAARRHPAGSSGESEVDRLIRIEKSRMQKQGAPA